MEAIEEYEVMHPVPITEIPNSTKIFNSYMMCHRKSQGGDKWKYKSRLVADGSSMHTWGAHHGGRLLHFVCQDGTQFAVAWPEVKVADGASVLGTSGRHS